MKYMHFNSSCSYAGLANMLEMLGYDTEDYKIALDIGLPYFLGYDEVTGYYQAGAMLQSKEWFDLYLKPRGFCYTEKMFSKLDATEKLHSGMMLGIQVNPQSKHAVIFVGKEAGKYLFLNNKWEESSEEETLYFSREELLDRLQDDVTVGYVETCEKENVVLGQIYDDSRLNWIKLRKEIKQFIREEQSSQDLRGAMNRLFRPLLVDGLAMMKLLERQDLVVGLESAQKDFLLAVKSEKALRLTDEFDCLILEKAINVIIENINKKIDILSRKEKR